MAAASAIASSMLGPVDAPVRTRIANGLPAAWSRCARAANARGTALAAPAAVNALNATSASCGMSSAASSALRFGNGPLPTIAPPSPGLTPPSRPDRHVTSLGTRVGFGRWLAQLGQHAAGAFRMYESDAHVMRAGAG